MPSIVVVVVQEGQRQGQEGGRDRAHHQITVMALTDEGAQATSLQRTGGDLHCTGGERIVVLRANQTEDNSKWKG